MAGSARVASARWLSASAFVMVATLCATSVAQPRSHEDDAGAALGVPGPLHDHVRRGTVLIEPDGTVVAVGTVLDGDGRILTALSSLGGASQVDVRYGDGTMARAALVRRDAAHDLALLSPETGGRTEGLRASDVDASSAGIAASLLTTSGRLAPARASGLRDLTDSTGETLRLLDVDAVRTPMMGTPLLDPRGRVLAVMVRACEGGTPAFRPGSWSTPSCRPVIAGVPVLALRAFLAPSAPPPRQLAPMALAGGRAWLGIQGRPQSRDDVHGVRVLAVAPSGPAAQAGLTAGDVVVAVDGEGVPRTEDLAATIAKRPIDRTVRLLVCRKGEFRDVTVALQAAPGPPPTSDPTPAEHVEAR